MGLTLTGAHCNVSRMLAATLDAMQGVRAGRRRRRRRRPDRLNVDTGSDHRRRRRERQARNFTRRMARRLIASSEHRGRRNRIVDPSPCLG
jgi:hypothetical protein